MTIEEAIKQTKPFTDPYHKVMVNLIFTNNWLMTLQSIFFRSYDLTYKQYNILRILRGYEKPMSTAEIRSRMLDKMSDVSRIADRLIKKDMISKSACDSDQRKVDLVLTEAGMLTLKEIDKHIKKFQKTFMTLSEKECNQLSDLLDKMRTQTI